MIEKFEYFIKLSLCVLSGMLAYALLYLGIDAFGDMTPIAFFPYYLMAVAPCFLCMVLLSLHKRKYNHY